MLEQLDPRGDAIRVYVDRNQPLPNLACCLHPPCFDADNNATYFASAALGNTVQPCRVTRKDGEFICTVPHKLMERTHQGNFTILPFMDSMELVPTSHGRIPAGYRPVVGGLDERGRPLYHAVAWVGGERIPGRTSEHLGAAAVLFGAREHYVYNAHELLCWRDDDIESFPPGGSLPELVVPDVNTGRVQTPSAASCQARPGDVDSAGTYLRVTISDLSTVTSYPATTDLDGNTSLHFGSAILPGAIYPGKVTGMRTCQVLQDDAIVDRTTGFSILPFNSDMELVQTSRGAIPQGRRPVEGNYDAQGRKLYHAMLYAVGRKFPGMCAEHLGGAQGVLQGAQYKSETGYDILCWKQHTSASSTSPVDVLQRFSYKEDLAGQRIRVPLNGNEALTTDVARAFGDHIPNELDNYQWFFASVLHQGSIIPTWAYPSQTSCSFAHEGKTVTTSTGLYCVLPYLRDRMMLVPASDGKVPVGMTPVEGGKDNQGRLLYHAVGRVGDTGRARMIGMAAEHLGGAVIVCWGNVHMISSGYELLCWKA